MSEQFISVGMCTRNRGAKVVTTVQSILANTYAPFELILIDQSTNDDTIDALAPFINDPRLRLIRSQEHGIARARNVVVAEARSSILLMTDDDCTIPPDWIAQMIAVMERNPDAALVFCRVDLPPDFDPASGYIPVFQCEREQTIRSITYAGFWGIGAGMGMRRDIVRQIGGFDPFLGAGSTFSSGEEVDLQLRVVLRSHAVVFSPQPCVIHYGLRTADHAKHHVKRDVVGTGAVMAKIMRHGDWRMSLVVARNTSDWLRESLGNLLHGKRPGAVRRLLWMYRGIVFAWNAPVDRERIVFQLSQQQAKDLAFLFVEA